MYHLAKKLELFNLHFLIRAYFKVNLRQHSMYLNLRGLDPNLFWTNLIMFPRSFSYRGNNIP